MANALLPSSRWVRGQRGCHMLHDDRIISDHSLITAEIYVGACAEPRPKIRPDRNGCGRNWTLMLSRGTFYRSGWTPTSRDDVSAFFSLYDSTIRNVVNKHVVTKDVLNRSRLCSSWFNHRCQATKWATQCLERRYRCTHTADYYRLWCAQYDHQQQVFRAKYAAYWSSAIDMCPDSRSLWNRMNSLLRLVASTSVTYTADDFSTFFTRKVDTIRATTATADWAQTGSSTG